jgi:hypothetical protein
MGQKIETQRQLIEGFLQDLLFLAKEKDQMDLLVEVLLAMQQPSESCKPVAGWQPVHDTRFEIVKISARGNVSVGAIRGIDEARKVLVCLNTTEREFYFLRDAASGKFFAPTVGPSERNNSQAYLN